MTELIDYLRSIGFKPVLQRDGNEKFTDPTYLEYKRLYAELHDDGRFYLWFDITTPIYKSRTDNTGIYKDIEKIINNELK